MPERPSSSPASGSKPRRKSKKFVVPQRRKKKNPNQTPGPGAYDIGGLSKFTGGSSVRSPGWGFGSASRYQKAGRGKTELAGLESPGPATYDISGTTRRDGGSSKRWMPHSYSFPGSENRPSPFKEQRSPGPIYYYPTCEHDSDHRTTPKFSMERTPHESLSAKTIGPGPTYNLRNGRVGTKILYIGDVTHKTAQWATCSTRPTGAADRGGDLPGPATYDPADMNKCAQNSEEAPSFTMRNWTPYLDLPKRPPPKKFEKGMPPVDPGIGPKYDVGAKAGGSLPNKADPPSFSFCKDERFWDEDP